MSDPSSLPRHVGRYDVLAPIAHGGTATVFLARARAPAAGDPPMVALKLPHTPLAHGELVDEAKLTARISHPNVVRVLDVGIIDSNFFLVMEYVEGESLAALLRAGVPPAVARRVLDDALAGLAAAHDARDEAGRPLRIVHRDFSPQNLLVGVDGVTRLTDFGIARAVTRAQVTHPDMVKGKAPYMSPEQAQGLPLDQRSDVWSAGVVAWELLAERPLFPADDPLAAMARIVSGDPPRLRTVRPDLPAALDEAVARALVSHREARCATVAGLREALNDAWGPDALASREEVGAAVRRACGERIATVRREAVTAERVRARRTTTRRLIVAGGVTGIAAAAWAARGALRPAPRPGAEAQLIATAQAFPRAIVLGSDAVYWSAKDGVFKAAKHGKSWFVALASLDDARGIALDDRFVYVAELGRRRICRVPRAGGAPEVLADGYSSEAVAFSGGTLYFADNDRGAIFALPARAETPRLLAEVTGELKDSRRILGLVLDERNLYWTDTGRRAVHRLARAGGTPVALADTGPEPYGMALDDDTVYWRDGTIDDGRVMAVAKRGGRARALVERGMSFPRGIAVDDSGVYWTAGDPRDGRIERARPDGSERRTLTRGHLGVHSLALDDTAVYFTAWGGGSLWRVLKPPR